MNLPTCKHSIPDGSFTPTIGSVVPTCVFCELDETKRKLAESEELRAKLLESILAEKEEYVAQLRQHAEVMERALARLSLYENVIRVARSFAATVAVVEAGGPVTDEEVGDGAILVARAVRAIPSPS